MIDEYRLQTWTCAGRRRSHEGKLCQLWLDGEGEEHWFARPIAPGSPGSRYEVWTSAESVVARGERAPRYLGLDDEEPRRTQWACLTREAEVAHELARRAKKAAERDALEELLAPLQIGYRAVRTRVGRRALLATVFEIVTREP